MTKLMWNRVRPKGPPQPLSRSDREIRQFPHAPPKPWESTPWVEDPVRKRKFMDAIIITNHLRAKGYSETMIFNTLERMKLI